MFSHKEKIPSAIERYQKEILRVFGVLENILSKQAWLVGDKCTIADLSFIPWNASALRNLIKDYNGFSFEKDFPVTYKWHNAMIAQEVVRKAFATREAVLAQ